MEVEGWDVAVEGDHPGLLQRRSRTGPPFLSDGPSQRRSVGCGGAVTAEGERWPVAVEAARQPAVTEAVEAKLAILDKTRQLHVSQKDVLTKHGVSCVTFQYWRQQEKA